MTTRERKTASAHPPVGGLESSTEQPFSPKSVVPAPAFGGSELCFQSPPRLRKHAAVPWLRSPPHRFESRSVDRAKFSKSKAFQSSARFGGTPLRALPEASGAAMASPLVGTMSPLKGRYRQRLAVCRTPHSRKQKSRSTVATHKQHRRKRQSSTCSPRSPMSMSSLGFAPLRREQQSADNDMFTPPRHKLKRSFVTPMSEPKRDVFARFDESHTASARLSKSATRRGMGQSLPCFGFMSPPRIRRSAGRRFKVKAHRSGGDRFIPASDLTLMAETFDTSVLGAGIDVPVTVEKGEEMVTDGSSEDAEVLKRRKERFDEFLSDTLLLTNTENDVGQKADGWHDENDAIFADECFPTKGGEAVRVTLVRREPLAGMSQVKDQTLETRTDAATLSSVTRHLFGCPLYERKDSDEENSNEGNDEEQSEVTPGLELTPESEGGVMTVIVTESDTKKKKKKNASLCLCHQMTASVGSDFLKSPMRTLRFLSRESAECSAGATVAMGSALRRGAQMLKETKGTPIRQRSHSQLSRDGGDEKKEVRRIAKSPTKILDAPDLVDDFYLNTLAWSSKNVLAVGLRSALYLSNVATGDVKQLHDFGSDLICGVGFNRKGARLSVGTGTGTVMMFDSCKQTATGELKPHSSRCGVVAWRNSHSSVLATGSRDRSIWLRDCRVRDDVVVKLSGHSQEVCGLQFSASDEYLASGGNDNRVYVWDPRRTDKALAFGQHKAAVKALSWSALDHNLLASGGGTSDRCIKLWDVRQADAGCPLRQSQATKLSAIRSVDTGSQVCNLLWSKHSNELVSTHGYSLHQISVWRCPQMEKLATLTGHTYRVLYLAASPDGKSIVTGAGDQTLRFWDVFPGKYGSQALAAHSPISGLLSTPIR